MSAFSCAVRAQSNPSLLVVRDATLVDVKSGREIPEPVLVVRGERIAQIGPEGKMIILAGARSVDARGKWIIAGTDG